MLKVPHIILPIHMHTKFQFVSLCNHLFDCKIYKLNITRANTYRVPSPKFSTFHTFTLLVFTQQSCCRGAGIRHPSVVRKLRKLPIQYIFRPFFFFIFFFKILSVQIFVIYFFVFVNMRSYGSQNCKTLLLSQKLPGFSQNFSIFCRQSKLHFWIFEILEP